MADIKEILRLQNPWWTTGKVPESKFGNIKRKLVTEAVNELSGKKITGIIGPRRSGKTTFLHTLISHLLSTGTEQKRIFYMQLENPNLQNPISELIEYISESVEEPLEKITSKIYIFLDEVHKIKNWENEIKQWQDLNLNLKFILSGSSALGILKGSGEGLVGRVNYLLLLPLSFKEIIEHKYKIAISGGIGIDNLKKEYAKLSKLSRLEIEFKNYLLKGGYPETLDMDTDNAFKVLLDQKDLSLQRDLFESEEIRDVKSVKELVKVLASIVVERINYSKIGSILGIKSDTVKKYIGLLEDIYLLKEMKVFSKKPYFSARKERKIIFFDNGMLNAINLKYDLEVEYASKIVENQVCRMVFEILTRKQISAELYYWIDEYDKEIDCILEAEHILPIEVKYRNQISRSDLTGTMKFMEKFKLARGIIVTKDILKEENIENKQLVFVPAWLFLLTA